MGFFAKTMGFFAKTLVFSRVFQIGLKIIVLLGILLAHLGLLHFFYSGNTAAVFSEIWN